MNRFPIGCHGQGDRPVSGVRSLPATKFVHDAADYLAAGAHQARDFGVGEGDLGVQSPIAKLPQPEPDPRLDVQLSLEYKMWILLQLCTTEQGMRLVPLEHMCRHLRPG